MALIGLGLAMLGMLALIASAIILIVAVVKNKDSKLVSGLMLLTSLTLIIVGGIIIQVGNGPSESAKKTPMLDAVAKEEIKGTYESEIKPQLDELIERLDSIWTENWQVPFEKMSNLEMTSLELSEHLSILDKSYFDLSEEVEEIDLKAIEILSAEESSKVQEITLHLRSVIIQRSTAATGLVEPLRNGTASDADFTSALEVIEMSNEDILLFSALKAGFENEKEKKKEEVSKSTETEEKAVIPQYEIVSKSDSNLGKVIRISYWVVPGNKDLSEEDVKLISEDVLEKGKKDQDFNAAMVYFINDKSQVDKGYDIAMAEYSPEGDWAKAMDINAGDYKTHELKIKMSLY